MENEVFGAAGVVPCELLNTMPSALNHVIQDVTNRLVDRVMCELEKGESICSLQTVEQNQFFDLNSVEIRRTVKIKPLVRCKECKHHEDEEPGMVFCPKIVGSWVSENWFCADGERRTD